MRASILPSYIAPSQAHIAPSQAHIAPSQAHIAPSQAHIAPSQAHKALTLFQGLPFALHYYLVIARSHVVSVARPLAGKKRRRKGKIPAAASQGTDRGTESNEDPPVFDFFENEILQKVCNASFNSSADTSFS